MSTNKIRRPLLALLILFFCCNTSFADISTTTTPVDQNFIGAQALYAIDFDLDGDIDIIGAGANGNEVAWWENDGAENFTKWSIDAAFNDANSVFAFDIDQDGDIDVLATSGNGNTVAWWENDGNPLQNNWAAQWNVDAAFNGANSVSAVDVDFDGDIDVIATAVTDNDVAWWENDGNPRQNNWAAQWTIDAAFNGANSIFAIDMDIDGDIDMLATAGVDNDVSWWENDGNPRQNNWVNQWDIDANFNGANAVFAIDMDIDGDIDVLATAQNDNDVSWWENNGNPRRNAWTKFTIDGTFNGAESIYVKDLDFDGDIDVMAAAGTANDISWWENDGNPHQNNWTENAINLNFNGASFVFPTDLDSDGDFDIIGAADLANDIAWWENDEDLESGNIGFSTEYAIEDFFNGASSVTAIDLDIDGDIDVIGTADIADDLIWWENDNTPTDGGWVEHTINSSFDGACCNVTVDLDRDGDIDIVAAASNDDEVAWWDNDGSETFTKRSVDASFNGANSVFVIDLDTDGDLDIVATAGQADDLAWYASDGTPGDGGWTKTVIDNNFNGAAAVFCIDLDIDGDMDILGAANIDDDVAWWDNDGAEGFTKRTIDSSFNGAVSVKAGDLDADGDLDVIACAYNVNTVNWYANDGTPGDGGWTEYTIVGDARGVSDIKVLDFDLDGDIDVVGSLKVDDAVAWWENDGTPLDGGWTEHVIDSDFNGAVSVFPIDLDIDGDIDILGAAETGDDITWWENGGADAVVTPSEDEAGATAFIAVDFTVLPTSTAEVTTALPGGETEAVETEVGQEVDVKCFIATAAYGTHLARDIKRLCQFRDNYLLKNRLGKRLVNTYYKISPPIAKIISESAFLRRITRSFIKLLLKVLPVAGTAAAAEDSRTASEDDGVFTVGTITLSPPEDYVVVEDLKTGKKRLYKKSEYQKAKTEEAKPLQTISIEAIEYRYRPVKGGVKFISEGFELVELKGAKAVLKKDYIETPIDEGPLEELDEEPEEEIVEILEETEEEEKEDEEITAKRLLGSLFFKIESKKISDHEWEIGLPSTLNAAANFSNVLSIVMEKLDKLLEPEKSTKIYLKSSIGKGVLGPDGLLIEDFNSRLRVKCGIEEDDLIKMVNGRSITTIQDVASVFAGFSGEAQTVTVRLVRDEEELTLTYYIR